jgi:uncharacterized protein (TIGR03086 family)
MPETDRRHALTRSFGHASGIVEGVRPDQLAAPTPCPDFLVADLVDHIVGAAWRIVALGRGESPATAEFPPVDLAAAPDQLRLAGDEAEAAWSDDARLTTTVTMPWGETCTGATLVDMYLAELAAHAWDLAAATDQLDRLDPGLASDALASARAMLKPEYRDLMGNGNPYGVELEAPAGASDWERLAAFMGRQPRRSRTSPAVTSASDGFV